LVGPQVVEIAGVTVRIESEPPKKPQIPCLVGPVGTVPSASRLVTDRRCSSPAVHPSWSSAPERGAAHPHPFVICWNELPEIIEIVPVIGIVACAPKHPEVSIAVLPIERIDAAPWRVSSGRDSKRAVHTGLVAKRLWGGRAVQSATPAHPCPHVSGRVELPKVIENALYTTCIISLSSKEPKITVNIRPCRFRKSPTGEVSSSWFSQNAILPGGTAVGPKSTASAHPGPLVAGRIELPEIIWRSTGSVRGVAPSAKEPEIAVLIGPGYGFP
jgi:hypothetical protein